MKCQMVKVTGSRCRATAEGIVVPEDTTPQAIYDQKLWLCPKHGRQVLKGTEGGQWVTLAAIETALADTDTPLAEDAEPERPQEVPCTVLYTTAPEEYDGFGARTIQVLGTYAGDKTYRQVSIPAEHAAWYQNRCGSGMHNTHTEDEWQELQRQPFFQAKFRPRQEDEMIQHQTPRTQQGQRGRLTRLVSPAPTPIQVGEAQPVSDGCAAKRAAAAALAAQAEAARLAAKQAQEAARQAEQEARAAEREAQRLARQQHRPQGLDRLPTLKAAIEAGGASAIAAIEAAIADGTVRLRVQGQGATGAQQSLTAAQWDAVREAYAGGMSKQRIRRELHHSWPVVRDICNGTRQRPAA